MRIFSITVIVLFGMTLGATWIGCSNRGEDIESKSKTSTQKQLTAEERNLELRIKNLAAVLPSLEQLGYKPATVGIDKGVVIVCGRYIPPPYQVSYNKEQAKVFINGVDVCRGAAMKNICYQAIHKEEIDKRRIKEKEREVLMKTEPYKKKCEFRKIAIMYARRQFDELVKKNGLRPKMKKLSNKDWKKVYKIAYEVKALVEANWPELKGLFRERQSGALVIEFPHDDLPSCVNYDGSVYSFDRYFGTWQPPMEHPDFIEEKYHYSHEYLEGIKKQKQWEMGGNADHCPQEAVFIKKALIEGGVVIAGAHDSLSTWGGDFGRAVAYMVKKETPVYKKKRELYESLSGTAYRNAIDKENMDLILASGVKRVSE